MGLKQYTKVDVKVKSQMYTKSGKFGGTNQKADGLTIFPR